MTINVLKIELIGGYTWEYSSPAGIWGGLIQNVDGANYYFAKVLDADHPNYVTVLVDAAEGAEPDEIVDAATSQQCTKLDQAYYDNMAAEWNSWIPFFEPFTGDLIATLVSAFYGLDKQTLLSGKYWDTPGFTTTGERTLILRKGGREVARISFMVVTLRLDELYECTNTMNRIPNDYVFPEPLPVENSLADVVHIKRPEELFWDQVQIDRSHLILVASDQAANPDPTIRARWDVQPPEVATDFKANATFIGIEVGQVALDADGWAPFQLPPNTDEIEKGYAVFIDDPHLLDPDTIGKVVLIGRGRWEAAQDTLRVGVLLGGEYWVSLHWYSAATLLSYFVGRPDLVSVHEGRSYSWDEATWKDLVKGDIWYEWLTHKVGVTWSGNEARVPLLRWYSSSGISERIRNSEELAQLYEGALEVAFPQLKALPEGHSLNLEVSGTIRWDESGSSPDLHRAIDRARLSGTLHVRAGSPHPDPNTVNIEALTADMVVADLYDFNYFNRPITSGNAAILQAGWKRFSNTTGGPGQVFFTEFLVTDGRGPFPFERTGP